MPAAVPCYGASRPSRGNALMPSCRGGKRLLCVCRERKAKLTIGISRMLDGLSAQAHVENIV